MSLRFHHHAPVRLARAVYSAPMLVAAPGRLLLLLLTGDTATLAANPYLDAKLSYDVRRPGARGPDRPLQHVPGRQQQRAGQ